MIIKKMQPARYLGAIVFLWGIVATFTAFVQSFGALVACRLLLGIFEAGLFPGVVLYLSMCKQSSQNSIAPQDLLIDPI
jgi:MFS family permease